MDNSSDQPANNISTNGNETNESTNADAVQEVFVPPLEGLLLQTLTTTTQSLPRTHSHHNIAELAPNVSPYDFRVHPSTSTQPANEPRVALSMPLHINVAHPSQSSSRPQQQATQSDSETELDHPEKKFRHENYPETSTSSRARDVPNPEGRNLLFNFLNSYRNRPVETRRNQTIDDFYRAHENDPLIFPESQQQSSTSLESMELSQLDENRAEDIRTNNTNELLTQQAQQLGQTAQNNAIFTNDPQMEDKLKLWSEFFEYREAERFRTNQSEHIPDLHEWCVQFNRTFAERRSTTVSQTTEQQNTQNALGSANLTQTNKQRTTQNEKGKSRKRRREQSTLQPNTMASPSTSHGTERLPESRVSSNHADVLRWWEQQTQVITGMSRPLILTVEWILDQHSRTNQIRITSPSRIGSQSEEQPTENNDPVSNIGQNREVEEAENREPIPITEPREMHQLRDHRMYLEYISQFGVPRYPPTLPVRQSSETNPIENPQPNPAAAVAMESIPPATRIPTTTSSAELPDSLRAVGRLNQRSQRSSGVPRPDISSALENFVRTAAATQNTPFLSTRSSNECTTYDQLLQRAIYLQSLEDQLRGYQTEQGAVIDHQVEQPMQQEQQERNIHIPTIEPLNKQTSPPRDELPME